MNFNLKSTVLRKVEAAGGAVSLQIKNVKDHGMCLGKTYL